MRYTYYTKEGRFETNDVQNVLKANLHKINGPAVKCSNGTKHWYQNNKRHRTKRPAIECSNGANYWYVHGKCHREDGPAVERSDNRKEWYLHGKRHREDGPAVEYEDGTKLWFQNDNLHRENGPAVEYEDGTKLWYLNNIEISEQKTKIGKCLYHVTFTKNIDSIKKEGILQSKPGNWFKGDTDTNYVKEAGIFSFEHPEDALNWANKMEFDFNNVDVSIIRINFSKDWHTDPSTDPALLFGKGRSLRSQKNVNESDVLDYFTINDFKTRVFNPVYTRV